MAEQKLEDYESNDLSTDKSSSSAPTSGLSQASTKDSNYAWVILFASFMCQVLAVGFALSSGVFTPTLLDVFQESRSETAWVGSLHSGFLFFAGPLSGVLVDRFGYRIVVMGGAILATVGIALSACVNSLWILYITYGVVGGIGFCMTYIPAVTILASYFDRWKHVAFSTSAVGAGIGTLALPHFIQFSIDEFGWRGGFILTAGATLQLVVFGSLLRDPPKEQSKKQISTKEELSILSDWKFQLFLLNNYMYNFGSLIVFVLIADYARSRSLSLYDGVNLISIVGISNAVGRIISAMVGVLKFNKTYIYIVTCTLSGVCVVLITVNGLSASSCFIIMATCCAGYGVFFGMQLANLAVVTNTIAGIERLNAAYGIVMLLNGLGAATGPPFAGYLYGLSASYELVYYVGGGVIIAAGLILIPIAYKTTDTMPVILPASQSIGDQGIVSILLLDDSVAKKANYQHRSLFDVRLGSGNSLHNVNLTRQQSVSYSNLPSSKS